MKPAGRKSITSVVRERCKNGAGARSWARKILIRRLIAGALAVTAGVLAVNSLTAGHPQSVSAIIAVKDLPAGTQLADSDIAVREVAAGLMPTGAFHEVPAVRDKVLASSVRAGEALTDVRLIGPENIKITTGDPKAAAVPIKLADARVADLLQPGSRIDVIGKGADQRASPMLATDAIVLSIRQADGAQGGIGAMGRDRLIVVALPREKAAQVAAAALSEPLAITLR